MPYHKATEVVEEEDDEEEEVEGKEDRKKTAEGDEEKEEEEGEAEKKNKKKKEKGENKEGEKEDVFVLFDPKLSAASTTVRESSSRQTGKHSITPKIPHRDTVRFTRLYRYTMSPPLQNAWLVAPCCTVLWP